MSGTPLRPSLTPLLGETWPRLVANFVLFQCAWFASVLGAARGYAWLGLLAVLLVAGWHLSVSARPPREAKLMLAAMLLGAVWESALVSLGLLSYPSGMLVPGLAPPWIVAMWALFALTLNVSMRWLKRRWALAGALGAVAGPLSFMAGERLGAVSFASDMTVIALSAGWAGLMPLMMWLSDRYDGVVASEVMEGQAGVEAISDA